MQLHLENQKFWKLLQKKEAIRDFVEKIFEITKNYEDSKNHEVDMTKKSYVGNYASLLMLEEENNKYQIIMVLNTRIKYCIPIFSPLYHKQLQKNFLDIKSMLNILIIL